jgi:AcrR family transcriptional regulator
MARRNPVQKQSPETVGFLYEAVARILEQGAKARLTTNHIAEKAGISIGTLYGYFPNKASLLTGMALKEAERQQSRLMTLMSDGGGPDCPEAVVRHVMRAALRPFGARSQVRSRMMELLMRDDNVREAARSVQDHVITMMMNTLSAKWPDRVADMSDDARFVLAAAVFGAVQSTARDRPDYFETQEFEDEITGFVVQRVLKKTWIGASEEKGLGVFSVS